MARNVHSFKRLIGFVLLLISSGAFAQPKITAFSPASAVAGASVTINGSGFDASQAGNVVYFGAAKATVTGASATSLTVSVPFGATYEPISVLRLSTNLVAYSPNSFLPTFINPSGSGLTADSYKEQSTTADKQAANGLYHDLDGDGKLDLIALTLTSVEIYRNASATGSVSSSSFQGKVELASPYGPRFVSIFDMDGDGKPDIVFATAFSVSVVRNTSTPGTINASTLQNKVDYEASVFINGLIISDMDVDGKPDIVLNDNFNHAALLLRNNISGGTVTTASFQTQASVPYELISSVQPGASAPTASFSFTIGDADGDGRPDIVFIKTPIYDPQADLSVIRNVSTPGSIAASSFAAPLKLATARFRDLPVLKDLDGDGKPEIMAVLDSSVAVLRNLSLPGSLTASSFAPLVSFTTSPTPNFPTLGDVDGDGKPDILTTSAAAINISVLRNNSVPGSITASSFAPRVDFPLNTQLFSLSVRDVDGDGLPEIMGSKISYMSLLKLNTNITPVAPVVSTFAPASGPAGTQITINGQGFNTNISGNTVYIGGVKATVTASTAASLTVTAPVGTAFQPISVLNNATGLAASSSKPFITTFANPFGSGIPANYYLPSSSFSQSSFQQIAVGDLDGDGKPDIVGSGGGGLFIQRNISTTGSISRNSFTAPLGLTTNDITDIALGDVDGDGKLDIVSVGGLQNITVWKNNSTPGLINAASFSRTNFTTGYYPFYVKLGDLDGDGKPEIATGSLPSSTITVLRNTGKQGTVDSSSFTMPFDLRIGGGSFAINDLDGDGKPELITSGSGIAISRNLSTPGSLSAGSFAASVTVNGTNSGSSIYGVSTGDLNGDGKPEVVYTDYGSTALFVLQNNSTPGSISSSSFSTPVYLPTGGSQSGLYSLAIGDLDGDGRPDLVGNIARGVAVLRNLSGAGSITGASFAAPVTFADNSGTLATADLDGDGIPEIVTSAGISVLRINNVPQQPVIQSITPASAAAGTSVTITGLNFNATPASNIVFFGAVKAPVTGGTTTSLTVVVPAGATHAPVSILNKGNTLIGYSTNPFNITFSNPAGAGIIPTNFYKQKLDIPTGTLPYQVALGDLDVDGKPDMVVVNETANTISILRNGSTSGTVNDSSFAPRIDLPVGADPRAVAIGDLNLDGQPDIVVANAASGTVTVFCYIGFPSSSNQNLYYYKGEYTTGSQPFSVAIGDVDGDGQPDIITANQLDGTISVLRNTNTFYNLGTPSFAPKVDFAAGTYPRAVTVSDVDGDGKADVIVANERSNTLSVLRNNSGLPGMLTTSSLAPMVAFATGSSPNAVTTSDVDGDGKPDLVVCNYGSGSISVLRNLAVPGALTPASFAAKVDFATGAQPFFVTAGEVDGDGKPDLISVNASSNSVSVLRNTSLTGTITAASFDAKVDFATSGYPVGAAAGDLDGDGITELAVVSAAANAVSVLSVSSAGHPLITSLSPDRGPAGAALTIAGANFNAVPQNNTVYFGAVKAPVTAGTTNSLTVNIPPGATYQPVTVLDNARGLTGYSSKPFISTFTNPFGSGVPANFYRPRVDFPLSGPFTYALAFGDIDGDGKPDMVAVNEKAGTVSVLRNITPTGSIDAASFAGRVEIATAAAPRSVAINDLDGDGRLDIIVGSPASYTITVLRNTTGSGAINASQFTRTDFTSGAYISAFAVGDLDDDGRPDLVFTNPYANTLSVRRNLSAAGSLSFAAPVDFGTGNFPRVVVTSDVDGDGKPDLVVANEQSNTVSVLRNTGKAGYIDASSFASKVDFPGAVHPPALAAGDVDGDGKPDLVIAGYDSSSLSVLRNTSTPGSITAASFAPLVNFATGNNPYAVVIGDADGDGRPDLITANSTANTVSVLRNTGTAGSLGASSFAPKVDFGAGGYPLHAALGDLDGDGIAELGVANAATGAISVLKIDGVASMTTALRNKLTATAEQTGGSMELFPNPTAGAFTLQLLRAKGAAVRIELVSENGTVIEQRAVNTTGNTISLHLTLRHQPAGVYYVKVTGVDGVQIVKVVKR